MRNGREAEFYMTALRSGSSSVLTSSFIDQGSYASS
jgi:hypothetical protein